LAPEARYRAGECLMQQQDWPKAIEQLLFFRDKPEFQNVPGVSDRGLLRLSQAYAQAKQWDPSRQACETLLGRFPQSPLKHEARYGMAFAWQNQKQLDQAANTYQQVTNETSTEIAAKAQLQLALCRVEQKRYPEATTALLTVPYTYDYPQWSSAALLEAARLLVEQQQPKPAGKLLEKVIKDYPDTDWSKAAQQRLTELQAAKKL
jgi:TolA-binding protein